MKKIFLCLLLCIISLEPVFSQENPSEEIETGTFFITAGPNVLFNFDTEFRSAPSPMMFSAGFGAHIPIRDFLDFSPHIAFFSNYYLFEDGIAFPAEIEHRTALVPSLLIDFPVEYKLPLRKSLLTLGGGLSILTRYAFLATGVPDSEKDDIKEINSYLWGGARWLYPMLQAGWDYVLPSGIATGALVRAYFPLGSFIDPNPSAFQSMILSFSLRFHLSTKLF